VGVTKQATASAPETEAGRLANLLHSERNPIRVARILVEDFGLEQRQLAEACGVSESSVSEWLSGSEDRVPHQRGRILELGYVVLSALVTKSIAPTRLREWIASPMDYFLGEAPLAAIARGNFEGVADAARDFATGRLPV
jgi:transcriptional regulator with XRE-family HTH domain